MLTCMRAYREIRLDGVLRPDHVPTLVGDSNDLPGYSTIGRLFAIGYLTGFKKRCSASNAKQHWSNARTSDVHTVTHNYRKVSC
jgi:D-mannonate dehydratase